MRLETLPLQKAEHLLLYLMELRGVVLQEILVVAGLVVQRGQAGQRKGLLLADGEDVLAVLCGEDGYIPAEAEEARARVFGREEVATDAIVGRRVCYAQERRDGRDDVRVVAHLVIDTWLHARRIDDKRRADLLLHEGGVVAQAPLLEELLAVVARHDNDGLRGERRLLRQRIQ